jgi:hypothetical protein
MLCSGLILFVSTICFAEFYKYKDSNGILRFTDNLAEVPESQRPKVDKYNEYIPKTPDTKAELLNAMKATEDASLKKLSEKSVQSKEFQIQDLGNKIAKIQEDLQNEYKQLLERKKSLEAMDQKAMPKKSTQIISLNEQAAKLNKDIREYNQKKEICLEAIKKYQKELELLSSKGSENQDRQ